MIKISPLLLVWPGKTLSFVLVKNKFEDFIYLNLDLKIIEFLCEILRSEIIIDDLENLSGPLEYLIQSSLLIKEVNYPEALKNSEPWVGFRLIDLFDESKLLDKSKIISEKRFLPHSESDILLVDGFFSKYEISAMSHWFEMAEFSKIDVDNIESQYSRHWVLRVLDLEKTIIYFPILKKINRKVKFDYENLNLEIIEVKMYSTSYGDLSSYHQDSEGFNSLTVVVYFHNNWDINWGGEVIVCDKNWEPYFSVFPKPGRMMSFNGILPHKAGTPTRNCFESRKAIVLKYRVK